MKLACFFVGSMALAAMGVGGPLRGAIQFAEDQTLVLGNDGTAGAARSTEGVSANPDLAFDNRSETMWRASVKKGSPVWIEYAFAGDVRWQLTAYALTSGMNDVSHDPREWTVAGSNDGESWTTLDERKSGPATKRRSPTTYPVNTNESFSRFRITFRSSNMDRLLEVGEVGLVVRTHVLPPDGFSAQTERGGVALRWSPRDGVDGYTVMRAAGPAGPFEVIASGVKGASYLDAGPFKDMESSYYAVCSQLEGRPGAPSAVCGVLTPVNAPSGLSIKRGDGTVVLAWEPVARAAAYVVRRSLIKDGPYTTIGAQITAPAFKDQGLAHGTAYYYVVCGVANGKEGVDSAPVAALFPPLAPTGLKAEGGRNSVVLAWDAVALADKYQVLRAESAEGAREFLAEVKDATTFTDQAVAVGKSYYYSVVAVNACGTSAQSAVASGSPQKPPSWWRR